MSNIYLATLFCRDTSLELNRYRSRKEPLYWNSFFGAHYNQKAIYDQKIGENM